MHTFQTRWKVASLSCLAFLFVVTVTRTQAVARVGLTPLELQQSRGSNQNLQTSKQLLCNSLTKGNDPCTAAGECVTCDTAYYTGVTDKVGGGNNSGAAGGGNCGTNYNGQCIYNNTTRSWRCYLDISGSTNKACTAPPGLPQQQPANP